LQVRSIKGDVVVAVTAAEDPADIGPCDVVLLCVKSYDTEQAAGLLKPLLSSGAAVVSFQNGVDNEDKIAAAVGSDRVIGGAAFIFSSIAEPGVVAHTGGPARLVFGELDGERSARVERLLETFHGAAVDAEIAADIGVVLWTKFAFICATAGMTATARLPVRDICTCPLQIMNALTGLVIERGLLVREQRELLDRGTRYAATDARRERDGRHRRDDCEDVVGKRDDIATGAEHTVAVAGLREPHQAVVAQQAQRPRHRVLRQPNLQRQRTHRRVDDELAVGTVRESEGRLQHDPCGWAEPSTQHRAGRADHERRR